LKGKKIGIIGRTQEMTLETGEKRTPIDVGMKKMTLFIGLK